MIVAVEIFMTALALSLLGLELGICPLFRTFQIKILPSLIFSSLNRGTAAMKQIQVLTLEVDHKNKVIVPHVRFIYSSNTLEELCEIHVMFGSKGTAKKS